MILPQNDGVGHLSRTDENIRPGQSNGCVLSARTFAEECFGPRSTEGCVIQKPKNEEGRAQYSAFISYSYYY